MGAIAQECHKVLPHTKEQKMLKIKLLRLDFADVFDDGCFREIQVRQNPKVWELSFLSVQNMGALVLSVRKYGSCRLKLSKVWELSL